MAFYYLQIKNLFFNHEYLPPRSSKLKINMSYPRLYIKIPLNVTFFSVLRKRVFGHIHDYTINTCNKDPGTFLEFYKSQFEHFLIYEFSFFRRFR